MNNNVLHIFPYTIFAVNYVNSFLEDKIRNHIFYLSGNRNIMSKKDMVFNSDNDIVYECVDSGYKQLEEIIQKSDVIVFQRLPEGLDFSSKLIKLLEQIDIPLIIAPWGREILKTSDLYKSSNKELIEAVDKMNMYFVKRADVILMDEYGYKRVKKIYGFDSDKKRSLFNNARVVRDCEFKSLKGIVRKEKTCTTVMVGHRGTESSNHEIGFNYLKSLGFKVNVLCPLSIGEKKYIEHIIKCGETLFKDRFICLKKWLRKEDYYKYLCENVDIAIFNTDTAEGIVTGLFLLSIGVKVYMQSEVYSLYKEIGFKVFLFDETLEENDFLTPLSEEEKEYNYKKAMDYCSLETFLREWDAIFEYCEAGYW